MTSTTQEAFPALGHPVKFGSKRRGFGMARTAKPSENVFTKKCSRTDGGLTLMLSRLDNLLICCGWICVLDWLTENPPVVTVIVVQSPQSSCSSVIGMSDKFLVSHVIYYLTTSKPPVRKNEASQHPLNFNAQMISKLHQMFHAPLEFIPSSEFSEGFIVSFHSAILVFKFGRTGTRLQTETGGSSPAHNAEESGDERPHLRAS